MAELPKDEREWVDSTFRMFSAEPPKDDRPPLRLPRWLWNWIMRQFGIT